LEVETRFAEEPTDAYSVSIVDGRGNTTVVGVMTFFGAAHHAGHAGSSGHHHLSKTFQYDVSADIPSSGDYMVMFESLYKKTQEITIESMSLYRY
jgi:hypothetical protein